MAQTLKKHKARPHVPKGAAPKAPSKPGKVHTKHAHRTMPHAIGAGKGGHGGKHKAITTKSKTGKFADGKAPKAGAKLHAGAQPKGGIPKIPAFGAGDGSGKKSKKQPQMQAFE